jgi:hypothetical protein
VSTAAFDAMTAEPRLAPETVGGPQAIGCPLEPDFLQAFDGFPDTSIVDGER